MPDDQRACGLHTGLTLSRVAVRSMPPAGSIGTGAGTLDGAPQADLEAYLERVAVQARQLEADVWVVHDPQPLPLVALAPLQGGTIWRCHIDSSTPNPGVREYLLP